MEYFNILELPEGLNARRRVLEAELKKVVMEQVTQCVTEDVKKLIKEYRVDPKPTKITWNFCGESDDEGGTVYYPRYIQLQSDEGEIDTEEYAINKKSKWSDKYYDYSLKEELSELLNNYREDLYDYDIEGVDLN